MFLVWLLGFLALAGVGIYFLMRYLRNVQPDTGEVKEDIGLLKAELAQWKGTYAKWSSVSPETLPPRPEFIDTTLGKDSIATAKGVMVNLAQDPVMAFAYKKYIAPGTNAVMYVVNSDHEFIFRFTNKGTEVAIDGVPTGLLRKKPGSVPAVLELLDARNVVQARIKPENGATLELNGQNLLALPATSGDDVSFVQMQPAVNLNAPLAQAMTAFMMGKLVIDN